MDEPDVVWTDETGQEYPDDDVWPEYRATIVLRGADVDLDVEIVELRTDLELAQLLEERSFLSVEQYGETVLINIQAIEAIYNPGIVHFGLPMQGGAARRVSKTIRKSLPEGDPR